jgi:hypothetical protein
MQLQPCPETVRRVAQLIGAESVHTGGGIWNVRVADPSSDRQEFYFGMEPGDVVGFDRIVDGEHASSGGLTVNSDDAPEVIAEAIRSVLREGKASRFIQAQYNA